MAEKKKYNSILISGRKDQTLTYSKYVKDEESGESVKESLDKKVNVTDELTTQQIKDGAITNEKMAADSVGNTNLQDGSVSNEKLEDGSITNKKLAENSITKDKLQDKTIGVEKLDNELRQAIAAATGLPEDLVETIQNVDDTLKDHQSQLDDKQSQIDYKQQQITANDEDISLLKTRSTQMEETIKGIAATGGASKASAVTYENTNSGLNSINAQGAIDEVSSIGHFAKRGGIVNISTNYNSTNTAEVLTLEQAIAKVPSTDRVLGFQGKYLAFDGWHTIIYTDDNLTNWSDKTKWIDLADKTFNSISNNATFAGIAKPTTNPGTPDGPVFYLATETGTYSNFNDISVTSVEAVIFQWNDGAWTKKTTGLATEQEIIEANRIAVSDNAELNNIISEIHLTHLTKEQIESVRTISIYKAWGKEDKYYCGLTFFNASDEVVAESKVFVNTLQEATDIVSRPLYEGGVDNRYRIVLDWSKMDIGQHKQFRDLHLSSERCSNIEFAPTIYNKLSDDDIYGILNNSLCVHTSNFKFNGIVSEMYLTRITKQQVASITQINLYKKFKSGNNFLNGLSFFDSSSNIVIDFRKTFTNEDDANADLVSFYQGGVDNRYKAIIDWSKIEDGTAPYFSLSMSDKVLDMEFSPTIKSSVNDVNTFENAMASCQISNVSNNAKLNNAIREIYLPTLTKEKLNSITHVVLYNGFYSSGLSKYIVGVSFYNSSDAVVFDMRNYVDSLEEVLEITSNSIYLFGKNAAVINWSSVNQGAAGDYNPITLPYAKDIAYSPTIKSVLSNDYFGSIRISPEIKKNEPKPLVYFGDTKVSDGYLCNAVAYPNGVIIGARSNGTIVKIDLDGNETTLLTIQGATDWRLLWMDSDMNVYASPHRSVANAGTPLLNVADRGLYRLAYNASSFTKVISLYDASSSDPKLRENNDDTIWTMCEDASGNLYGGVYSHSIHYRPTLYKSADKGVTWNAVFDFLTISPNGHHVHCVTYNKYNNALYVIIGEVNTIYKSTDGGASWIDLDVKCEIDKGTALFAVEDGLIIGSDSAYNCIMSKLYADDKTIKTNGKIWANTVFGIRQSDVTGWIYAFCKIDSSVGSTSYYPPISALTDPNALNQWKSSAPKTTLDAWIEYSNSISSIYPQDAIRPQHCAILISKDNGETWQVLWKYKTGSGRGYGFITAGQFKNGECLAGWTAARNEYDFMHPVVISEGQHKYVSGGIELDGNIFVRTCRSTKVTNV